ncbi:copper chaperone CopZ [Paraburkholderia terricola]|uniref:hypothetical protein n=1 Tax=Paraburkholderia terricola TaxID=169427 RepID=UPI00285AF1DC|nr:hypothetical protein [Paraburkholderia terricola]MDR6495187.1 copper chaperone CopZ [Paraburkholderia terricola]
MQVATPTYNNISGPIFDWFSLRNTVYPARVFEIGAIAPTLIPPDLAAHGRQFRHVQSYLSPIYWRNEMKFSVKDELRSDNISAIEHAIKTVDADAKVNVEIDLKTISVESWLMPEEFIVAFVDEGYDVTITEA